MEEWFTYGGEPGYFRLNVNVTDSATEGAVVIYSTEEILRRIATVKRLSAHLEGVSYMVRRGINLLYDVSRPTLLQNGSNLNSKGGLPSI